MEESTSSILEITIQRTGGALTNQIVRYDTYPDGISEFFGGSNVVTFAPNQREATVILVPQNDNIPEMNETFSFNISSADGRDEILGSPTSVIITILANDDYAGVFHFHIESLSLEISECTNRTTITFASAYCYTSTYIPQLSHSLRFLLPMPLLCSLFKETLVLSQA